MNSFNRIWRRLVFVARRKNFDRELDEEIRFHLEMKIQENLKSGMSHKEAGNAAQREFGNQIRLRERSREMWGFRWLEELLQDLHYGLRMLRRSPGSAIVAVLTFGLGIGANTAIFTLLHGLFLRSLPVSRPGELARINLIDPAQGSRPATALVPWQMFELLRLQQRSFVDISAWTFRSIHMRECGAALLTGNAFEILGVKPHLASVLGHPRWFAQKIAYCLRQSGSLQLSGKKATRLYTPASHLHRDQIVPQLAVRARWRQWLPMMIRLITPTNASTPLLTEVLNIVQRAA